MCQSHRKRYTYLSAINDILENYKNMNTVWYLLKCDYTKMKMPSFLCKEALYTDTHTHAHTVWSNVQWNTNFKIVEISFHSANFIWQYFLMLYDIHCFHIQRGFFSKPNLRPAISILFCYSRDVCAQWWMSLRTQGNCKWTVGSPIMHCGWIRIHKPWPGSRVSRLP